MPGYSCYNTSNNKNYIYMFKSDYSFAHTHTHTRSPTLCSSCRDLTFITVNPCISDVQTHTLVYFWDLKKM